MEASETRQSRVIIDHLFGFHRGSRQVLTSEDAEIGTAPDATIHFPSDHEPEVAAHHARISRRGDVFELILTGGDVIQVNGTPVTSHLLSSGDLIVVGKHGPVIRFRTYRDLDRVFKSIPEALADCRDGARAEQRSFPGKVFSFIREAPHEMLRQTAPWTRTATFSAVTLLLLLTGYLTFASVRTQHRLDAQAAQMLILTEEDESMTNDELEALRSALESQLGAALERVEALENMSAAGKRIVVGSAPSVVFLMGEFGFVGPDDKPLRTVVSDDGQPVKNRNGSPIVSPEGEGPPFKKELTGTGFVAAEGGLLITNRHVVLPWEYDRDALSLQAMGYTPVMHRMIAYFPGMVEAVSMELVVVSDSADVAVLRCLKDHEHAAPLPLSATKVSPGDEVFVMGYPTGIRALLARTDVDFVTRLLRETERNFWSIAARLSEDGRIAPLATRGIVGQVTPSNVVYDAETTRGGSGGPVIGLDGGVVAVNAAILTDFGGSNLGVPIAHARRLLGRVTAAPGASAN